MKFKALKECFVDGSRRRKDSTFEYTPPKDSDGNEIIPKYLEPVVPRGTSPAPVSEPKVDMPRRARGV